MPDLLLDALPVIDLLEITANTSAVAQLTQRDQSSVSRIYRQASKRLGLQFAKAPSGDYCAGDNQALLQQLRRSSQHLRLHNPIELRWLGCRWSPALAAGATSPHPLPNRWNSAQRTCELVRNHLLDLAIVPGLELLPGDRSPLPLPAELPLACGHLLALPLVHYPLLIAADQDHPLHAQTTLSTADLAAWPLQAEASDPAPQRDRLLQRSGLKLSDRPATIPRLALQLVTALELECTRSSGRLQALPVATGLADLDLLVMRSDLYGEPALMQLVQAVVRAYRQAFRHHPDLHWLR